MNVIIEQIHGFLAFAFLISIIISVGYAIVNVVQNYRYTNTQMGLARFVFIIGHLQLLVGLINWFMMGFVEHFQTNAKALMTDKTARLISVEHPLMGIVAIVLVSIGYFAIKKTTEDRSKQIKNLVFYGIALLLVLSRLPWNLWLE